MSYHIVIKLVIYTLILTTCLVPLCASSLSLLEDGANMIDDTASHFAEVREALRDL